jgi:GNAT superfamily N-acetyltransferase
VIRPYGPADRAAVIALFRAFMQELTPPRLQRQFTAYVEKAISEELGRIDGYYLGREGQGFWVAEDEHVIGMAGIERRTSDTAEDFCRRHGYRRIVPSTSELQAPARRLYESSGYRLEREESDAPASHKSAGAGLTRYHYEKAL